MSHARQEIGQLTKIAPDVYNAIAALGQLAGKAGLDKQLLELIKIRASQINGCAYCVQYHILQANNLGVPVDKINLRGGLARSAAILQPGARGAGLDRSADAARP